MIKANKDTKVIVGMSGGVDSSVVAALLKEQGYDVHGLFMRNWEERDDKGFCQATADYEDVQEVCAKLDIPCNQINLSKDYWNNVFKDFLKDYQNGLTPNPDILCNKEIKFKVFYDQAMTMGADFLATGHYCRVDRSDGSSRLAKGIDSNKDQSYFLHAINGDALNKVLFPIGDLEKTEVREIAAKYDLVTKNKKDSTGICFIGEKNFKNFLSDYVHAKKGEFQLLNGETVGKHSGNCFFTMGQRKGLGLGGQGKPWFVVDKDIEKNIVFVERGEHPALYSDGLSANEMHWINESQIDFDQDIELNCKIRYRQKDQKAYAKFKRDGHVEVRFAKPQRAICPGQYIVFYDGDLCLGGARIQKSYDNYYKLNKSLPEFITV